MRYLARRSVQKLRDDPETESRQIFMEKAEELLAGAYFNLGISESLPNAPEHEPGEQRVKCEVASF